MATKGDFGAAREQLIRAAKCNGRNVCHEFEKKLKSLELNINSQRLKHQNKAQKFSVVSHTPSAAHSDLTSSKLNLVAADTNCPQIAKHQTPTTALALANTITNNQTARRRSYRLMLLTNKTLLRDTLILAYAQFASHMFYYYLTIDFAYTENLSLEANFITSGIGEWIACLLGAIALRFVSRRACMSLMMSLIGLTFAIQALIDSRSVDALAHSQLIVTTNNAIGTVSALLLIFVTVIVSQEVYPTVVRQSGTSIVNTLGESGSSLAPLILQLTRAHAHWSGNVPHLMLCALGAVMVQFVSETDDKDLSDT